jgi:hypothetical protein
VSDDEVRPRRLRRWISRLAVGLLVLLAVLALVVWGGRAYVGRVGTERLGAVTAELDAADPDWRMEPLLTRHRQKELPPEENSLPVVMKVDDLLPNDWRSKIGFRPVPLPEAPFTRPDQRKLDSMRAYKDSTAEARALARTLRGLPNGHHPIAGPEEFRKGLLPPMSQVLDVAKLLHYDGALAGLAGDTEGTVEAAHAALNTGRSLGELPALIAQLTRAACAMVAVEVAKDALVWGEPTRGLAELQTAFAQEADAPRLLYALLGERAWIDDAYTRFDSGAMSDTELTGGEAPGAKRAALIGLYRGVSQGEHAECLRAINEAVAAARLPFEQQLAAFAAVRPPTIDWRTSQSPMAGRAWRSPQDFERYAWDQLRIRVNLLAASAGIACERFRRAHGRWPASLEEIPKDILPAVPIDPFDGKSLRLNPLSDGIAVVAMDHLPPGAPPTRPPQERAVFRLWDPNRRGPDAPPQQPKPTPVNPETKP